MKERCHNFRTLNFERKEKSQSSETDEKRGGRTTNGIALSHPADMSLSLEVGSIATNLSRRSHFVGLQLPIVDRVTCFWYFVSISHSKRIYFHSCHSLYLSILKQKTACSEHSQQRSQHLRVLLPPPPACAHSTPMPPTEIRCPVRGKTTYWSNC